MTDDKLGRVGLIARFKPLHNGAYLMLESVCEKANEVVIGVGSSNKYNQRNPFTAKESEDMLNLTLSERFSNYSIIHIPDFSHIPEFSDGQKWRQYVLDKFGKLDHFVSANPYVRDLLKNDYQLIEPYSLIDPAKRFKLRATKVRVEMAKGDNWESLVPTQVSTYLKSNGLVDRFRKEFGLQVLARLSEGLDCDSLEDLVREKINAGEK